MDTPDLRIDKWLWAVRLLKTRSLATDECRAGHIQVNGHKAKPARTVRINEVISVRTGPLTRTVRVTGLIDRRIGASLVDQYYQDLTPATEYERLKDSKRQPLFSTEKGLGRPTKKDRRAIDRILDHPEDFS